ncbi:MAG: hypothetical protein ACRD96_09965, partial [Bryobacteraceae bacterium]
QYLCAEEVENGRTLLPQMYGDPRGYKHNGPPSWYHFTPNLRTDRLTEIYLWSMDRKDLERVPVAASYAGESGGRDGYGGPDRSATWLGFLEGKLPDFPERTLRADLASIRRKMEMIRTDQTTADTRLADYLLDLQPAATNALVNLTLGGYFARGRVWVLHSRFRYFDPVRRRAGLPEDVGALVEKLGADSATLTLVNVNPIEPRTVVVQAGGYGEHRFDSAAIAGSVVKVDSPVLTVRLEPGAGSRIEFKMARYASRPTFAYPWDRGWYGKP